MGTQNIDGNGKYVFIINQQSGLSNLQTTEVWIIVRVKEIIINNINILKRLTISVYITKITTSQILEQ